MSLRWDWSNISDNGTIEGEIVEGFIEILIWSIGLELVKYAINQYAAPQKWFKNLDNRPGGSQEWVMIARAWPNHTLAAILVYIGYLSSNLSILRSGTLIEFGYEVVDLLGLYYSYWTTPTMHTADGRHLLQLWTFHHLPGILVIIPANLYIADDVYFQKIVCLLLVPTILIIPLTLACKTLDLHNLRERTQFTTYYVINIVIILVTRVYYWHLFCIQYYFNTVIGFNIILQIVCIFYYGTLTIFNLDYTKMVTVRLYRYCFVAETENDMIEQSKEMQNNAFEMRLHKALAEFKHEFETGGTTRAKFIKTPFRRLSTEPILKFD